MARFMLQTNHKGHVNAVGKDSHRLQEEDGSISKAEGDGHSANRRR